MLSRAFRDMGPFSSAVKWCNIHKPLKFFSLFCVLFFVRNNGVSGSDSDKYALLAFKDSVSDPNGSLNGWNLENQDHCSWTGISCDSSYRVVALNLTGGGNSVSCARISQFPLYGFGIRRLCLGRDSQVKILGKLSLAVAKLSELKILSLPFNELNGEIPVEIWGMEKLEVLDLEGNFISGELPTSFSGLTNLKVLNLGFNELFGELPSSLSNCAALQLLNLAGNQINGSIPGFFGGFRLLRGLYLSYNQLSGSIPVEIGDGCGKLEHLDLSSNYLSEAIPKSLGNCGVLKTLLLCCNALEDTIPNELGQMSQLEVLDVSRNNFGGAIPSEIGNCTKLEVLVLSNSWDPLPDVSRLDSRSKVGKSVFAADEFNFYDGSIPAGIMSLSSLRMLWAPRANLEGNFPSSWGQCNNLEMLNLAQNFFTGEISERFSNCKKLKFLDLSSNRLSGEINDKIPVPCMIMFDISGNFLSGSIPKFKFGSCSPIQSNHEGSVEPYDPFSAYVSYFGFRTQIKEFLSYPGHDGSFVILHNFGSNNFTGPVLAMPIASARLGNDSVYAFLAGMNKLTGTFPGALFEKCDQVKGTIVNVTGNGLSGQIPTDIATMCKSLTLLDASSNKIAGSLPPSFGSLISLFVLNLSWNTLQGPIPSTLGEIKDLRYLSLSGNYLNGSIPTSLGQLYSLEVLDLSWNSLSGEIPKDISNLRNLTILLLNNNKLTGQLPPNLANVSSLSMFNVSFNNLSGPVPSNDNFIQCNRYLGNPLLHCPMSSLSSSFADQQGRTGNLQNDTSLNANENGGDGGLNSIEVASITSASAIVSVLIALIVLLCYTRKWKPRSRVSGTSRKEVIVFTDIGVPLTFENVVLATGSFNASNCIGSGGFGATYKAEIAPGVFVAIKRLALGRFQGVQQFDAEIKTLGRLRHQNLVTLIGYHASETEMFLVYNYLPGGNLEKFIHERSVRAVDWRILHKIALDIARALAYLHDQCVPRVLHRDVKPSNILLDEEYNAYLSDFGLARLLGTSETHATTGVAGTFGYVAPEYAMTCRVSDKADVYSYGVVLLELISDKKALDPSFSSYGNGFNIVAWGSMLLSQGRAKDFFASGLWDAGPHDDLVEVLHTAVVCTVDSLSNRPTMKQVVRRLKQLHPPSW